MIDVTLNWNIERIMRGASIDVADIAPGTFEDLMRHYGVKVWAGASDTTIYGDAKVNWIFRAWHDILHKRLNADFSLEGETAVALEQARVLGGTYGDIIMLEVVGQVRHKLVNGEFVTDQLQWTLDQLRSAA